MNDPIGDLLTRMRNAQSVGRSECRAPLSRAKLELCTLLKREGWIGDVRTEGDPPKQDIVVTFAPEKPRLTLTRVSSPGQRIYKGYAELLPVLRGLGMAVLTTSEGLLTDREARQRKLGGEVLCTVS